MTPTRLAGLGIIVVTLASSTLASSTLAPVPQAFWLASATLLFWPRRRHRGNLSFDHEVVR